MHWYLTFCFTRRGCQCLPVASPICCGDELIHSTLVSGGAASKTLPRPRKNILESRPRPWKGDHDPKTTKFSSTPTPRFGLHSITDPAKRPSESGLPMIGGHWLLVSHSLAWWSPPLRILNPESTKSHTQTRPSNDQTKNFRKWSGDRLDLGPPFVFSCMSALVVSACWCQVLLSISPRFNPVGKIWKRWRRQSDLKPTSFLIFF